MDDQTIVCVTFGVCETSLVCTVQKTQKAEWHRFTQQKKKAKGKTGARKVVAGKTEGAHRRLVIIQHDDPSQSLRKTIFCFMLFLLFFYVCLCLKMLVLAMFAHTVGSRQDTNVLKHSGVTRRQSLQETKVPKYSDDLGQTHFVWIWLFCFVVLVFANDFQLQFEREVSVW